MRSEGTAEGRKIPLGIPIGADAVEIIRNQCGSMTKYIGAWKVLSASADLGEPNLGWWNEQEKKVDDEDLINKASRMVKSYDN